MNQRLIIHQTWAVLRVLFARLRFLSVFLIAGFIVGYWDDIKNHWDKWTRPAVAPDSLAAASEVEYYCVMHPNIVRDQPGNCPICGMPLVKRIRGELVKLPADVLARVQLSPQRITLGNIKTTPVEPRHLVRQVDALGVLDYDETRVAQLSARVAGRADELFIRYTGQMVRQGDPVYSLYSPELYAAQREYLLARKRVNELPANATPAARADAAAVYNATMEKLVLWGVTRQQLDQMDQQFDQTGKIPSHLTITSPISGVVVRKNIYEGDYVQVGDRPYTIADLSTLWLQLKLYESDVPVVQIGQSVNVTVDSMPDQAFQGTVTFKAFQLDPQTRTLDARVEVANPELKLRPGMFARASIQVPIGPAGLPWTPADQSVNSAQIAIEAQAFATALGAYLQMQSLLAKDQADEIPGLLRQTVEALQPLASDSRLAETYQHLVAAAKVSQGQDLSALRHAFKDVSAAMIEIGKTVGLPADAPAVQVFRCPMAKANWLQKPGETANPFYGSQMPTCGGPVETLPRAETVVAAAAQPTQQTQAILAIPRSAVIETGKNRIVYVESSPGVYDMRAVQLGPEAGGYYPVLSGLEASERVVTIGAFLVDSENRLNPMAAMPASVSAAGHQH